MRGYAWTNALLGIQADEIHICGDPRAKNLIRDICEESGDILTIKKYDRLSKLVVEDKPVMSYQDLREGDCIVSFSRLKLFALKDEIN